MFSQSQNWWRTNGNTPQSTDYLGTSNNSPLIIKTNSTERVRIASNGFVGINTANPQYMLDVNGRAKLRYNVYCDSLLQCSSLRVNNLTGSGNALLTTDAQGNIIRFNFSGNNNDVLTGNGNWVNINSLLPPSQWQTSGQNIYYNQGFVGIGTGNPLFSLDVVGDVRVSNNIYVGGGIVISDKVNAFTEVTAPKMIASEAQLSRMRADSIMMDSTKAIYGNTIVKGDVRLDNKLTIQGNAKFNGLLTATQGVMFNDSIGMKWYNNVNNSSPTLVFGKTIGTSPPPVNPNICITPYPAGQFPPNFQMWGLFQVLWNNTSLSLWADGANSLIDSYGNGRLLINYNCGKDVVVGNASSGNLIVNQKIGIGTSSPQKQLHINNGNGDAEVWVVSSANNGKAAIWLGNNLLGYGFGVDASGKGHIWKDLNTPSDVMVFDGSGNTQVNGKLLVNGPVGINLNGGGLSSSQINNALSNNMLSVNGSVFAIEYTAKVTSDWPDYVFDRKPMDIEQLDMYIQKNKRLPGFESAKFYEDHGMNLNEIIIKQQEKIEEIFLYLIELKKENELLKTELNQLKNK
ncbi:MAG: hypothetical protein Fur0023_19090 [Bacteroidia bacterium]